MKPEKVKRWADQLDSPNEAERAAAKLVLGIGPADELSDAALAKVRSQLGVGPATSTVLGVTKATLLKGLAIAVVALGGYQWLTRSEPAESPPPRAVSSPRLTAEVPPAVEVPVAAPVDADKAPPAENNPSSKLAKAPPPVQASPQVAARVSPQDALLEESRLLGAAVRQLRREQNPAQALETIETYFAQFPAGALHRDARAVQLDGLLAVGRTEEALAILETFAQSSFEKVPRAPELRVIRAELLASAGRFLDAAAAFDGALPTVGDSPALAERVLIGRATARARLGDRSRSMADFSLYLSRFPAGRFAEQAQSALKANESP